MAVITAGYPDTQANILLIKQKISTENSLRGETSIKMVWFTELNPKLRNDRHFSNLN